MPQKICWLPVLASPCGRRVTLFILRQRFTHLFSGRGLDRFVCVRSQVFGFEHQFNDLVLDAE